MIQHSARRKSKRGPFTLNGDSDQSVNLVGWWPLEPWCGGLDLSRYRVASFATGSPTYNAVSKKNIAALRVSPAYVDLTTNHRIPIGGNPRTICFWCMQPDATSDYGLLFEVGNDATSFARCGLYIGKTAGYVGGAGSVIFEITGATAYTSAGTLASGEIAHIALVIPNSTLSNILIYKNGVSQSLLFQLGSSTINTSAGPSRWIGAAQSPPVTLNAASMWDFRAYNRALTSSQIATIVSDGDCLKWQAIWQAIWQAPAARANFLTLLGVS